MHSPKLAVLRASVKKPVYWFLFFHLGLLFTGMCNVSFRKLGAVGTILDIYGRATGSRGSFGFFSPNVGNQFVIDFEVHMDKGEVIQAKLHELVEKETSIRIGNMYRLFGTFVAKPELRRSISSSLSTYVFEKYPQAKSVVFKADFYELPSLERYIQGKRIRTVPVYRATFERRKT